MIFCTNDIGEWRRCTDCGADTTLLGRYHADTHEADAYDGIPICDDCADARRDRLLTGYIPISDVNCTDEYDHPKYDRTVDLFPVQWDADDLPAPITESDYAYSYENLDALVRDSHFCTADCFTFEERADDPTIDDHFNARGAHKCSGAHDGMVQ